MTVSKSLKGILIILTVLVALKLPTVWINFEKPPLLRYAYAGRSGFWPPCPPQNDAEAHRQKGSQPNISTELQQRLEQQFPQGSDEKDLIQALRKQGFTEFGSGVCKKDTSIHEADFARPGNIKFLIPFTSSSVVWKVNQENKIVWIKGFVAYNGE